MPRPLLHPSVEDSMQAIKQSLPQALLLSGPSGVGLSTLAHWLCDNQPTIVLQPTNAKGEVDERSGTIKVELIRELYTQLRTSSTEIRTVIIDNSELMNHVAQNAFLKLLEEPNDSTRFILTSHAPELLLPTVRSRTQNHHIPPISRSASLKFLQDFPKLTDQQRAQLLFIASGLPAELTRLTQNNRYFDEQVALMTDAKKFVESSSYERLVVGIQHANSRQEALQFINAALIILRRSLSIKPSLQISQRLELLLDIYEHILSNGHVKLQLLRFVV